MASKTEHVAGNKESSVRTVSCSTGLEWSVIGHRGKGMNMLASSDCRMKEIKENTIRSFNAAAKFPVDFVEFDVQVTKDGCPIIFHDDFIITEEDGNKSEKRIADLYLSEFLSYGPQKDNKEEGKPLLRKTWDGKVLKWTVESDDPLCTLREAFEHVDPHLGFNIELKFDDYIEYKEEELRHVLCAVLKVVSEYAKERRIFFSSFQPDAASLMRKLQNSYPVFFLTNGGVDIYHDSRRNSLDEAINLCLTSDLEGIVSEVKAIFRHPEAIARIKEANLRLLTYGRLNNVPEAAYMQHLMGVDGVIVDLVPEITKAMSELISAGGDGASTGDDAKPNFSERELAFLLKLIPELLR